MNIKNMIVNYTNALIWITFSLAVLGLIGLIASSGWWILAFYVPYLVWCIFVLVVLLTEIDKLESEGKKPNA